MHACMHAGDAESIKGTNLWWFHQSSWHFLVHFLGTCSSRKTNDGNSMVHMHIYHGWKLHVYYYDIIYNILVHMCIMHAHHNSVVCGSTWPQSWGGNFLDFQSFGGSKWRRSGRAASSKSCQRSECARYILCKIIYIIYYIILFILYYIKLYYIILY